MENSREESNQVSFDEELRTLKNQVDDCRLSSGEIEDSSVENSRLSF